MGDRTTDPILEGSREVPSLGLALKSVKIAISNVSQTPTTFSAGSTHPGGVYWLKTQELPVGGSATFDIRAIRDQHVRDRDGKVLPAAAGHGQFRWSIIDAKDTSHLIGRIAIVSRAAGVSSSYSCPVCCPDSYWTGVLGPVNISVSVGGVSGYTVREDLQDCYGNDAGLVDRFASSWSVQFPSVTSAQSTGTGTGQASGLSGGSSTIAGHWNTSYYESSEFTHECFQFTTTADAPGDVAVQVPTSLQLVPPESYVDAPPPPYDKRRFYRVLDQNQPGQPIRGDIPGGPFVHEEYSNYQGNCSLGVPSTGQDGFTPADGVFHDDYTLGGSPAPPNPCTSTATQKYFVNGRQVATFSVTWTYNGVTVQ